MPAASFNRRLFFFLLLKVALIAAAILYAGIGLGPDEAQYWTWSQALDWGYYSKPPGVAWQIWLGTKLFGNTEWGVRSLSLLISFFQAWAVYLLALKAGLVRQTAFWCGLIMAFCPIGLLGSFFAITDGGFLICWTGACLTVVSALNRKSEPDPLVIGLWILAGALFKWPIYLFWLFYLPCRFWFFPGQEKGRLMKGIALSFLGLLPSVWWNWSHDWATFRHVFATLQGGSGGSKAGRNSGEFIGAQAVLLSPVLFILLIAGCIQWVRKMKHIPSSLFFCGLVTLASLGLAILVSNFQKVQGNWAIFAYPTAIIILGWYCFQEQPARSYWVKIGLALSVGLTAFFFLLPSFYTVSSLDSLTPPFRLNPFKHNMGWIELQKVLKKNGYHPQQHFLMSDKYQYASILSFYGEGQKRAYFLNLHQTRNNQFSYWPSIQEEQKGAAGYFIWIENVPYLKKEQQEKFRFYQEKLKDYFETVEFLELAPLVFERGQEAKAALIFRCSNCRDTLLPQSIKY